MKNKAVVFGTNQYVGLSVARCLGRNGIKVVSVVVEDFGYVEDYGFYSKYVDEKIYVPHYDGDRKEIVNRLIEYAKTQPIKPVLIPTADPHVEVIDAYLNELKEYYLLPPMKQGLYMDLLDKDQLYLKCLEHNVLTPKVLVPTGKPDFCEQVESEIGYPCIVKPVNSFSFSGIFKTKMFIVNNREELELGLKKASDEKQEVFVQKLIVGFDDHMYTFDGYMDSNGNMTHWATCQKQRQLPINFGSSTYTKQRYVPELAEIGERFFKDLGYRGFAEIEFKKDANDGKYYLIEINVRITNFNVLLDKLGINIPLIMYNDLTGQDVGTKKIKEDTGIHFCYGYEDFIAITKYIGAKQLSPWQVFKSLFAKKAYAIWSWGDPVPGVMAASIFARRLLKIGVKPKVYGKRVEKIREQG